MSWPAQVTVTPILQEVKLKYETIVFSEMEAEKQQAP